MSFANIAILLGLLGGCIYATVSVTLKILDYLQKKKDQREIDANPFLACTANKRQLKKDVVISITTSFLVHHRGLEPRTH